MFSRFFSSTARWRPYIKRNITRRTTMMTTTIGALTMMNWAKESPASEPIIMFGGSPISVAVPPMFDIMISTRRNGTGLMSSVLHSMIVIGPMSKTVVTLSRKAENTAVITANAIMMSHGLPLQAFADLMATNSNRPDSLTIATNIIMPHNTPSVLKSIDSIPALKSIMPITSRTTAPSNAASAR